MMLPTSSDALPSPIYRREFFEAVMAEAPASLLDVGCGAGAFVRAASACGCRAQGPSATASAAMAR